MTTGSFAIKVAVTTIDILIALLSLRPNNNSSAFVALYIVLGLNVIGVWAV